MKRLIVISFFALAAFGSVFAETDGEVNARKTALELAGAFSNDGFKIRDGHWSGMLKPHEPALIVVNLYAGNQYWFAAGTSEAGKKVGVAIYDETGRQVAAETYNEEEKAAAGFSPANSGQYFIAVSLLEGEPGSVCLVCSYK
ncbi:MAG: hypothetical protein M3O66_01825 [Verrucomicrobiota bacterium]|nr:hypothetical protein [Verrucomicrobiota bacterium]